MTTTITKQKQEVRVIKVTYTPATPAFFTKEQCVEKICAGIDIPVELIKSVTRKREICLPRQILMYIIRQHYFAVSLASIGELFSTPERLIHHDTVIHSCKVIEEGLDERFGSKLVREWYGKMYSIVAVDFENNKVNHSLKVKQ